MNKILNQLKDKGVLVFDTSVPVSLSDYTLNYEIPKSDGRLPDQIELDYRTVDDHFPYNQLLKELIYRAVGSPEDIKDLLFNCPDVIIQELKPNNILDWHHDAYTFDDGSKLQFEALLYISNVPNPSRTFMWKDKDDEDVNLVSIKHGTIILIDCTSDRYIHSAVGSNDEYEKIVTLLLGCR